MKDRNNLNGYDAINRAKALMNESVQAENTTERKGFSLVKKGADGNTYAIVKENAKYFIKKANGSSALVHSDFNYLMGESRKSSAMFESFAKATNTLNNILIGLNEMNDSNCGNNNLLTSDTEVKEDTVEEEAFMGDDLELQEEGNEFEFNINEMIYEENPLDEMENECMIKLDEMTSFLQESINEKYTLKIDAPKTAETPDLDISSMDDDANSDIESMDNEIGDDIPSDEGDSGDDNPFEDEPFDAGVEANEDEDPEKFLQQLSGKLATSLRQYQEENNEDVDTKKFVANTVLSAIDTSGMEKSDIEDIKDKLETAPKDDNSSEGMEQTEEPESDEPTDFPEEDEAPVEDEVEPLTEDDEEEASFMNAWNSLKKPEVNEELDDSDNEKIIQGLRDSAPKGPSKSSKEYKEKEGAAELSKKRKNMDPHKPLTDPVNNLNENYNKNLDEYLCSLVNPSIFVNNGEKKNEMNEQPVVKPEVKPSVVPGVAPSRRSAPFKRPAPQTAPPKFRK